MSTYIHKYEQEGLIDVLKNVLCRNEKRYYSRLVQKMRIKNFCELFKRN